MEYDLVVRGGTIIDGSGGAALQGDVAISNGRIVAVGRVEGAGREEFDASDRLVTPGFVDVHTHYDGQITWENRLAPSSGHGVTSVVMGNCGVGFAPVRPGEAEMMIALMEGVEDIPGAVMSAGIPFNWESFPEYLDAIGRRVSDIDFAAQIPHSALRVYVMGQRGVDRDPPTQEDLAKMRGLVAEAVEAGAIGVSTSRGLSHRFKDGRLAPSVTTEEMELMALAGGLKDADKGVFQLLPDMSVSANDEFALIRRLAEYSGRPISFSLIPGDRTLDWQSYLTGLAQAEKDNIPIRGQIYPRPMGILFGLDLSYHAFALNPSYRAIADLPLSERVALMRTRELRERLLAEEPVDSNPYYLWIVSNTAMIFPLGNPPNYHPDPADSIKARAASLGVTERELIYDELLRNDGKAILYCPMGNTVPGRFDAAGDLFGLPGTVFGLGDGGAHYGIICDGAYPTFVLTEYVRRDRPNRLSIERAISMLSREPAELVGLLDRGLLKPGYKADLNIIDLERLHLHAPSVKRDLPGDGKRLTQKADGFDATIVSGQITYKHGRPTEALPGRLIRGAKPAPRAPRRPLGRKKQRPALQ